jgi:hypothetical protein
MEFLNMVLVSKYAKLGLKSILNIAILYFLSKCKKLN